MDASQRSLSDDHYESGYASGSSVASLPDVYFTRPHLKFINQQLSKLEPQDVLKWCLVSLPQLWQTSAFGLTGLAIMDMITKLDFAVKPNVELIFLDTLYHFPQTLDLVERVKNRYTSLKIHTYKPLDCETVEEFEAKYGERRELEVKAVITGRRKSQGGKRGDLDIIEVDDEGLIKVNPLANWSFKEVQEYIKANNVPTNDLLDQGYRSVGDWHSTQPVTDSEDERAGRWKGRNKTECGIHNKKSRYAMFLQQQEEQRLKDLSDAINNGFSRETSA